MINQIRPIYGPPRIVNLRWRLDEMYAWTQFPTGLTHHMIRLALDGTAITQPVGPTGFPEGPVEQHPSVEAALARLGFEPSP